MQIRFALILYFCMVVHEAVCQLYQRLFKISEGMVQILLMLEIPVLFRQDFNVEDLFCGAPSGSEPSLFFSNYLIGLRFKPVQDNFQHDFEGLMRQVVL